jgi:hypothetical protein
MTYSSWLFLLCSLVSACGAPLGSLDAGSIGSDAGAPIRSDAGVDTFAGTWQLKGPIGNFEFIFPLSVVRANDGNYRGEYAGCALPLQATSATTLAGLAITCTVTAPQLQDSTYAGSTPQFGSPITLVFEMGTQVSVVAGIMSATGAFRIEGTRVPFTMNGQRR